MTDQDNKISLWTFVNSPIFIVVLTTIVINGSVFIQTSISQGVEKLASTPRHIKMMFVNQSKIKIEIICRLEKLEYTFKNINNVNSFLDLLQEFANKEISFYVFPEFKDYDLISLSFKYREFIINTDYINLSEEEEELLSKLIVFQRELYFLVHFLKKDIKPEQYNKIKDILINEVQGMRNQIKTTKSEMSILKSITSHFSK